MTAVLKTPLTDAELKQKAAETEELKALRAELAQLKKGTNTKPAATRRPRGAAK